MTVSLGKRIRTAITAPSEVEQPAIIDTEMEKIRIRILSSFAPGGNTFAFRPGDHTSAPPDIAHGWIKAKLAIAAPLGGSVEAAIALFGFRLASVRGFDPSWKPVVRTTTA